MIMSRMRLAGFLSILFVFAGCAPPAERAGAPAFPVLTGPYLGQTPPGTTAELFAPGIITTGMYTRDVAMTPDGKELYYGVLNGRFTVIMQTKLENGRWTRPEVAPFSADPDYMSLEPAISPDGKKLFFLSTRPPEGVELKPEEIGRWVHQNIWVVDRTDGGWSEPYDLGPPINTDDAEYFPSVTRDGTLYFTRSKGGARESYIYRSRRIDGQYAEPEKLPPEVNSTDSQFNAFIAPDESYIIVSTGAREDSIGGIDYYISFRDEDDNWTGPINMGESVNTPGGGEFSPYVSPDGKYLFFMAIRPIPEERVPERVTYDFLREVYQGPQNGNADIYWIDAGFIQDLKPKATPDRAE